MIQTRLFVSVNVILCSVLVSVLAMLSYDSDQTLLVSVLAMLSYGSDQTLLVSVLACYLMIQTRCYLC